MWGAREAGAGACMRGHSGVASIYLTLHFRPCCAAFFMCAFKSVFMCTATPSTSTTLHTHGSPFLVVSIPAFSACDPTSTLVTVQL